MINLRVHWRLLASFAIGALLGGLIWSLVFPFGFWFMKIWAGMTTGGLVGLILGTRWQFRDADRRSRTSGKFLRQGWIGLGLGSAVSLFMLAPKMHLEQKQRSLFRSLDPARIVEVRIHAQGREERRIVDRRTLESFIALARTAEPFHPDHEGTVLSFKLVLVQQGEAPLEYAGRIPTKHTDDIALEFRTGAMLSEILIGGGRKWLEEAIR